MVWNGQTGFVKVKQLETFAKACLPNLVGKLEGSKAEARCAKEVLDDCSYKHYRSKAFVDHQRLELEPDLDNCSLACLHSSATDI